MVDLRTQYVEAAAAVADLSDAELLRKWRNAELLLDALPDVIALMKQEAIRRRLTPDKNDAAH